MPKQVDIEIFNIARTVVDREAVSSWMEHLGSSTIPDFLDDETSDPAALVALAAKRCYMSFEVGLNPNITKVREDMVSYFDNILSSRHGSVLEHAVYSFAIEGVSRVFTAEMNRHRAGWAISEGSLRFIRFDKSIPFWMPTSLQSMPTDDDDLARRKRISRDLFEAAFLSQERTYASLIETWDMDQGNHNFAYKKRVTSCLRRIVGMGVATGGVWTGNIRALRHVIATRTDPAAEEEIFLVFGKIANWMISNEPLLFGDFHEAQGSFTPANLKV
jgi:thymidylate synthase (FAD)